MTVAARRLAAGLLATGARVSKSDPHLCPRCQTPIWRGQREVRLADGNWVHVPCLTSHQAVTMNAGRGGGRPEVSGGAGGV